MMRTHLKQLALAGLIALLGACASSPPAQPSTAAAPIKSVRIAPPASNSKLKAYASVIKDFKLLPGYLNVYQKDERFLLELKKEDFDRSFFFTTQRSQGIGERWLWGGMMLESGVGSFVLLSDRVQWVEKNTRFTAPGSVPLQFALANGFSDSLRGVSAILSQPHPKSGAILIDLNALALSDFSATAAQLQRTYRQPYQFDRNNSQIQQIRNTEHETSIELRSHYAAATLATPSPGQKNAPSQPGNLPDPRSMFIGLSLSISELPEQMRSRQADARVGYFKTTRQNFALEDAIDTREHLIHRWRLEKKDPAAALSEPVQPITYWLNRNIPVRYRDTIREAILSWNAAFERIGFKNAIIVKQQADDADWRSNSRLHASVQWFLGTDNQVAIGPSLVDPRSGEILDADIVLDDFRARNTRRFVQYSIPHENALHAEDETHCDFASHAYEELNQALDILTARGEIAANGPEAEALSLDVLRWVVMHEVGHTLGLRHNFRASSAYTLQQLSDPAFVAEHGLSASVMDYLPLNTALKAQAPSTLTQKILGPYDYWAIAYGYTPLEADQEAAGLEAIAARAAREPFLIYGEDSEAGSSGSNALATGIDPAVARFDLGQDPVAWFQRRLQLSRELWADLAHRPSKGKADEAANQRAAVERSLSQLAQAASNAARNIGGISVNRYPVAPHREAFTPIPASTQRATLQALALGLFQPDSFQFEPAFLARLAPNPVEDQSLEPMLPILKAVEKMQNNVLDMLFSDRISNRLLESELLESTGFRLAELQASLHQAIWQELKQNGNSVLMRRNLQRAHLNRLCALILKPGSAMPADARALARLEASSLQSEIRRALQKKGLSIESRAHLQESLATLDETLSAPLLRSQP